VGFGVEYLSSIGEVHIQYSIDTVAIIAIRNCIKNWAERSWWVGHGVDHQPITRASLSNPSYAHTYKPGFKRYSLLYYFLGVNTYLQIGKE
jgi:hypothetical protein